MCCHIKDYFKSKIRNKIILFNEVIGKEASQNYNPMCFPINIWSSIYKSKWVSIHDRICKHNFIEACINMSESEEYK